jgi:NAD(P)H-hydrate epimerase
MVPEAMVHGIEETAGHTPSARGLAERAAILETGDAFLVGPGMTAHEDTCLIVMRLLEMAAGKPLVVDADALNACAGRPEAFAGSRARVVLTPHPGELARLTGESVAAIQADRVRAAVTAAGLGRCVVVLKGAGTVVAAPDGGARLNLTGNPGMATGGTGDVLAGMIAGLSTQTQDICRAAEAAVWCHGLAGDRASWKGSQAGLVATDILQLLPSTLRMAMRR